MILKTLREHTHQEHEQIEAVVNVMKPDLSRDEYLNLLLGFYTFYLPLNQQLAKNNDWTQLKRIESFTHTKLAWLTEDLRKLGYSSSQLERLELCQNLPSCQTAAQAWGVSYVTEGSTLGGQIIKRHLQDKFADLPTQFFGAYEEQTGAKWKEFSQSLTEWAIAHPITENEILEGAKQTFAKLHNWLKYRQAISAKPDAETIAILVEELKTAKEAAEAANAAKSAFLANISHEIRTPIGAILGFAELMNDPNIDTKQRNELLSTIRRNGELLTSLINDILDLSKVETGRLKAEPIVFNLPNLVRDIISLFTLKISEKSISIETEFKTSIPKEITSDPTRLRQILINLIGNATQFTQAGKITVSLSFKEDSQKQSRTLQIDVRDTGVGIEETQKAKLFEPFGKADHSTIRKHGGTGLGLVVSRRLAKALGGDLVLTASESGKGSVFTLQISTGPDLGTGFANSLNSSENIDLGSDRQLRHVRSSSAANGPGTGTGTGTTKQDLAGTKILLVEDSPDNQFLVGYFLKAAGAAVDFANNGEEGVGKGLKNPYDIILMDIQMPVLDGYNATKQLRAGGFAKPIIALTAHAMKEERQRCLNVGCNDHMTKPVDRNNLITRITEHVRSR